MNKQEDLRLQKTRSIAAITQHAYQLYMGNFKRLFRASWPMAVIYALTFALATNLVIRDILPVFITLPEWGDINWGALLQHCWQAIAAILLFMAAQLLFASTAFWACRSHKQTAEIARTPHWWGAWPGLWYPKMLWKALVWLLKTGWRHLGTLFATALITMFITVALTFFCELPAFIIGFANIRAYTGAAMGDPLGMPDYLPTMTFVAFVIAGFVQAYVHLVTVFPFYYAYGSIDTLEQERKRMKI